MIDCRKCLWVDGPFEKRPDEPSQYGCTKRGWEGYTDPDHPPCGGVFFVKNPLEIFMEALEDINADL